MTIVSTAELINALTLWAIVIVGLLGSIDLIWGLGAYFISRKDVNWQNNYKSRFTVRI
jgi:hypothetical protein